MKVSIIVPIYNAEKYLEKCLDSIVNQTLQDVEIILVDDGSTDGSAEICKRHLSDSRVTYFRKENEGLAAARQDGMNLAKGEYIGFVDSDDWLELDAYEKMYAGAIACNADIVYCNVVENENGYRMKPQIRLGAYDRQQILSEILPKSLAYTSRKRVINAIRWSNCLRLYRRELLASNNIMFDRHFRRSQDLQLTYEATLAAQSYCYMGDAYLYHNRTTQGSLSRGYTRNMWLYYKPLIERLYADTAAFKEADLMPQMHLRAFDFVLSTIANELNPLCPNDEATRIARIREVMEDPICQRFAGKIDFSGLAWYYKTYYKLIQQRKPAELMRYMKRVKWVQSNVTPKLVVAKRDTLDWLTEGPVTGGLYAKWCKR